MMFYFIFEEPMKNQNLQYYKNPEKIGKTGMVSKVSNPS